MFSIECKPIAGVWGEIPWSGDQGLKPPDAEVFITFGGPKKAANFNTQQQAMPNMKRNNSQEDFRR